MTTNDMDSAGGAGKPIVFEWEGTARTNSRFVADYFDRAHGHVMRAIRTLVDSEPELGQSNFGLAEYVDEQGKHRPSYDMDRDGFTLVVMGFTGAKALKFKLAYIEAFNRMEGHLRGGLVSMPEHRDFPDWPLDEMRTKKGTADLYRMVYGPLSAQWVMPQLGFPTPPRDVIELGRQMDLFDHEANSQPKAA